MYNKIYLLTFVLSSTIKNIMGYDSYKRRFKRAELECELAHEDAENDRQYPNPSEKSINFKKFMSLKSKGDDRDEVEQMEFLALKKRYGWW